MATLTLGQSVRRLRTNKGLSRERLAAAAGCSSSTIRRLEEGAVPSVGILRRIAAELDVPLGELLERAA